MPGRVDAKIGYIDMQNNSAVFSALEDDIDPGAANTYWPGRYIGYVKFTHAGKGLLIIADVNFAETQDYVTAGNYQLPTTGQSESGAAVLKGQDGDWYLVLSNFSSSAQTVSTTLPFAPASYESVTGQSLSIVGADVSASLAGYTTGVFRPIQRHAGYVQRRFEPETGLFRSPPGFDRQPCIHATRMTGSEVGNIIGYCREVAPAETKPRLTGSVNQRPLTTTSIQAAKYRSCIPIVSARLALELLRYELLPQRHEGFHSEGCDVLIS